MFPPPPAGLKACARGWGAGREGGTLKEGKKLEEDVPLVREARGEVGDMSGGERSGAEWFAEQVPFRFRGGELGELVFQILDENAPPCTR